MPQWSSGHVLFLIVCLKTGVSRLEFYIRRTQTSDMLFLVGPLLPLPFVQTLATGTRAGNYSGYFGAIAGEGVAGA